MKKTALITGASRGIGEAIARALAAQGYNLILICHNNIEKMNVLRDDLISQFGIDITNHQGDIGNSSWVDSIFKELDSLDLLINNAGISHVGLLQDMSDEQWNHIIQTNLSSVFYTCRRAIPLMLSSHSGKIINISSMWGRVGASMEVAYSATKGGINAFTMALGKELAPSNIQVNAIACGVIDTDMNNCFSEEEMNDLAETIPAGRIGTPAEVASLVCSLINTPIYMTGQVIGMDGGYI